MIYFAEINIFLCNIKNIKLLYHCLFTYQSSSIYLSVMVKQYLSIIFHLSLLSYLGYQYPNPNEIIYKQSAHRLL